ncbi:MAG TPA: MFS transporter [Streptosporangiaceae bacterium]|nr:MFS transporter [Streptosporangiaceae bacterium]
MASEQTVDTAISTPETRTKARLRDGVFGNPDFVKLWAGESVSLIGTQVTQFALPLVAVITLKASAFEVGVLNALRFVPVIIVAIFAGVWLDRRRRRPVLIACALGNAVLISLVPISRVTGLLSIGLLYVITALAGTLTVVFDVGTLSYVPALVERRHLTESNSRIQASMAVAGIAGPGLAGLLVGLITAPITLSVDAVSYLFSAAGVIAIRKREPAAEATRERPSILGSISEGFRAVYGSGLLRILLGQSATLNFGFGAVSTVFTVYALRVLHLSPDKLGIAVGSLAGGALVGSLLAARIGRALGLGRTMAVAIVGVCASPLLLLVPRSAGVMAMAFLMAGWFGHGLGIAVWNVNTVTMRQALTPMRLLARMNATYRMLLFGALPAGAMAGGALGSTAGLRPAMVFSVIALTTPMLWLFFSPVFRLKEMPLGPRPDTAQEGQSS